MELVVAVCRSLVYFAWLTSVGLVRGKTTIKEPPVFPVYLKVGSKLDLLCEQSNGFKVQWYKAEHSDVRNYKLIDSSSSTGIYTVAYINHTFNHKLTIENVVVSDTGSYKCAVQSGSDMPFAVNVYVLQELAEIPVLQTSKPQQQAGVNTEHAGEFEEKPGLITNAGNSTQLGCSIFNSDIRPKMRWFRNDHQIQDSRKYNINKTFSENSTDSILTVNNVVEADVGLYTCYLELNNGNNFNQSVNLYTYPQVKPMARSKNLVEGKTLELVCRTWGWPLPNITWEREGGLIYDGRVSFPNSTQANLSTLQIEKVTSNDRAVYVCIATSFVNDTRHESNTTILVRVKGKFAPLLPLLGIVLEIVILCIVIYVYERNRARKKAERERKEAAENQSNSIAQVKSQGGRDNVRNRK